MSSQTPTNITSGEAIRSGTDIQGTVLPQDRNQSEMDIIEDLRMKLQTLERKNLELTNRYNQDMAHYEKELMKLRLELERGEALRRVLESKMSLARKDAQVQMYSVEDELCDAKAKLLELQARRSEPRQQTYESGESFWFSFLPEENITPRGPAPDVRWGPPRHRYCPYPRPDVSSPGTLYVTCPTPGTSTASESFWLPFGPRGISSPCGPAAHVHWEQPRHSNYTASGTNTTSDSVPSLFIPRGVSTPLPPVVPASQRDLSDEAFTPGRPIRGEVFAPGGRELSDKDFTSGSRSEFDLSYSRHFGPLRPLANRTADRMYYTRSDSDLQNPLWVCRQPSLIRIPLPSGRSSKAYSFRRPITSMYVQVSPTGIETISWLDDSSRIRPLSTFTMSTPSWERIRAPAATPVHPPAPANASFRVRPCRSHSLPPFRSVSQDTSPNLRRIHEI